MKREFQEHGFTVFADESVRTAADVNVLEPFCHGVNIKLDKAAGIRGGVRALAEADRKGLKVSKHYLLTTLCTIDSPSTAPLCSIISFTGIALLLYYYFLLPSTVSFIVTSPQPHVLPTVVGRYNGVLVSVL